MKSDRESIQRLVAEWAREKNFGLAVKTVLNVLQHIEESHGDSITLQKAREHIAEVAKVAQRLTADLLRLEREAATAEPPSGEIPTCNCGHLPIRHGSVFKCLNCNEILDPIFRR